MSNEINIEGSFNIPIQNIGEGASVEVTQILAKSFEHNDLLDKINTKQELFDLVPETNIERRLQLSAEINQLKETFEQFKRDVIALAETFNKIEINTDRLRRAKEFFDKGEIGEARAVLEMELEQMESEQKYLLKEKDHYEKDVLPNLIYNAEEFYLLAMATQTNYDNPNRFTETCYYFDCSIDSYQNKINTFNYAIFLQNHNQFKDAEKYYSQYLNNFSSQISIKEYAKALTNRAVLKLHQNKLDEALTELEEALLIYRTLSETETDYSQNVAITLNNLATLYINQNNSEKALKTYEEALSIYRKLSNINTEYYRYYIAATLNNLANLHSTQRNFEKAREEYNEALKIRRDLASSNLDIHLSKVAEILNNLGILDLEQQMFESATMNLNESLIIRRTLAIVNPIAYLPDVGETLCNLAGLNIGKKKFENALENVEESLKIYRELANNNFQAFFPNIAARLSNLAGFYGREIINKEKSIQYAVEAMSILYPHLETVPFTQEYYVKAWAVLSYWQLSDEEISQMIEERMNDNEQNEA